MPKPAKTAARAALVSAHVQRLAAEMAELSAVADARAAGATWEEIAADLGMPPGSAGNAHRKYSKLLEETRVVEVKGDPTTAS